MIVNNAPVINVDYIDLITKKRMPLAISTLDDLVFPVMFADLPDFYKLYSFICLFLYNYLLFIGYVVASIVLAIVLYFVGMVVITEVGCFLKNIYKR